MTTDITTDQRAASICRHIQQLRKKGTEEALEMVELYKAMEPDYADWPATDKPCALCGESFRAWTGESLNHEPVFYCVSCGLLDSSDGGL